MTTSTAKKKSGNDCLKELFDHLDLWYNNDGYSDGSDVRGRSDNDAVATSTLKRAISLIVESPLIRRVCQCSRLHSTTNEKKWYRRACGVAASVRMNSDLRVSMSDLSSSAALNTRLRLSSLLSPSSHGDDDDTNLWLRYLTWRERAGELLSTREDGRRRDDSSPSFALLRPRVTCEYNVAECLIVLIVRVYAERKRAASRTLHAERETSLRIRATKLDAERAELTSKIKRLRHGLLTEQREIDRDRERIAQFRSTNDALIARTRLETERVVHTVDLAMVELMERMRGIAEAVARQREADIAALRATLNRLKAEFVDRSRPIIRLLRTMDYPLADDDADDNFVIGAESYLRETLAQCAASGAFVLMNDISSVVDDDDDAAATAAADSSSTAAVTTTIERIGTEIGSIVSRCDGLKRVRNNHALLSTLKELSVERDRMEMLSRAQRLRDVAKLRVYPDLLARYAFWRLCAIDTTLRSPMLWWWPQIATNEVDNDDDAYIDWIRDKATNVASVPTDEFIVSMLNELLILNSSSNSRRCRDNIYIDDVTRRAIFAFQRDGYSPPLPPVTESPPLPPPQERSSTIANTMMRYFAHLTVCCLFASFSDKVPSIEEFNRID